MPNKKAVASQFWVWSADGGSPKSVESAQLIESAREVSGRYRIGIVLLADNTVFTDFWIKQAGKPWGSAGWPRRLLVLWRADPPDAEAMLSWRSRLIEEKHIEVFRLVCVPAQAPKSGWADWLQDVLEEWAKDPPSKESAAFEVGQRVKMAEGISCYHPVFLAVNPGRLLGRVLEQLDDCKRTYRRLIGRKVGERRAEVQKALWNLISCRAKTERDNDSEILADQVKKVIEQERFRIDRAALPKILLLGPTGTGKTLLARYLAWRTSPDDGRFLERPFKRIPIPEYLYKEESFEYAVFGYCKGAYTDAHTGNPGYLLQHMGGVIFFDEIGDASPVIQAKLLAYLDDYQVCPRGWSGDSIPCPMLVVAATNRPIDRWARAEDDEWNAPPEERDRNTLNAVRERRFRNDLFNRFNVVIRVPSLNERKEDLAYLIDALLQTEAFNPGRKIREVGEMALRQIIGIDYDRGNFRILERVLSQGCHQAATEGRDYLVASDIENAVSWIARDS